MASEGEGDSAWNRLPGKTFMRAICVGATWISVVQKQIWLNRSELGSTGQREIWWPSGFAGDWKASILRKEERTIRWCKLRVK